MTVFAGDPILAADMNRAQQRVIGTPTVSTSDGTASSSTSDQLIDTLTVPVEQGRRYKLSAFVPFTAVDANNAFFVLLREDSVSGTQLVYETFYAPVAAGGYPVTPWVYWTASATGNKTFVSCFRRNGPTASNGQPRGSGGQPRTLTLEAAD